ncbi:MAG: hypothetical protein H6Q90_6166 [Deltaproteobacteria bacterium]|nr:hypothetical protein [Deltaproteobacteria bacterium]
MNRLALLGIALLAMATGCLFGLPPPNHLHGGETLHVAEDSEVLEVMGPGLHKEDHRRHSHGQPLHVLAAGATVHVAADYEQQRALNAPNAKLADRNPWILVEVIESPVEAQRGWKGWIHLQTTSAQPAPPPAPTIALLPRASLMCPDADSNELACSVNLAASTSLRVLGCAGKRVQVELFTADGLYLHGFVNPSQFPSSPCTTASRS